MTSHSVVSSLMVNVGLSQGSNKIRRDWNSSFSLSVCIAALAVLYHG